MQAWRAMSGSLKAAGRWLERRGNPAPRGMTVIGSNPRNRTRLTGRLHFFRCRKAARAERQGNGKVAIVVRAEGTRAYP